MPLQPTIHTNGHHERTATNHSCNHEGTRYQLSDASLVEENFELNTRTEFLHTAYESTSTERPLVNRQTSHLSGYSNHSNNLHPSPQEALRRGISWRSSVGSISEVSFEEDSVNESECDSHSEKFQGNQDHQVELRKKILQIQQDQSLSGAEKAKRVQELMTKKWTTKQQLERTRERPLNRLSNKKSDFSEVTDEDRCVTYHATNIFGCRHYQRACKLQAHCCGKWDTCRFCHDEALEFKNRNLISTMMCMYCGTVQPAGQVCNNEQCGKSVAAYYCKECKLWDNDPKKNIYHCYDCGICRIGKGLGIDYFHCPTCNVCMAIGLKGRHKCIERNLESDCPICGEYMFTSTSTVIFMPCGHCMHHKCHQQYIQTSYQCPTCLKSLADMTEYYNRIDAALLQHKMPEEYSNTYSYIYCNDCEKRSHARFHFLYHKCGHCRGYNTKVISTCQELPENAVIAPSPQVTANLATPSPMLQHRSASLRSVLSDRSASESVFSSSVTSNVSGFWCHSCQLPTDTLMENGIARCRLCRSDFIENM